MGALPDRALPFLVELICKTAAIGKAGQWICIGGRIKPRKIGHALIFLSAPDRNITQKTDEFQFSRWGAVNRSGNVLPARHIRLKLRAHHHPTDSSHSAGPSDRPDGQIFEDTVELAASD